MNQIPSKIFVTGIDTNVGKTVVSAIVCEALKADYWKPVQSGSIEGTDSEFIARHTTSTRVHPSAYCFKEPVSPHLAAALEHQTIETEKIILPSTQNTLIIEGAGGIMVPLNENKLILDLIIAWKIPVIVVSRNYLGSINHTLLTCKVLQQAETEVLGIIFNGPSNESSEKFILNYTRLKLLGNIPQAEQIEKSFIIHQAEQLLYQWQG
jgi:dethiobiotin synthetase